jgi:hypothetical protein
MSASIPGASRRSFLASAAAMAAAPAIATLAVDALTTPAYADTTLPDYAPIPPSALGPAEASDNSSSASPAE